MRAERTDVEATGKRQAACRAVWALLCLASCLLSGCSRDADPAQAAGGSSDDSTAVDADQRWFADVTDAAGIQGRHLAIGARGFFFPSIMTAGAGWIDYDADGDLDLVLADGCYLSPESRAARLEPKDGERPLAIDAARRMPGMTPRLFRQNADHSFADVTAEAGLDLPLYCSGLAIGDVNNDGRPDLYLTAFGGDRLLVNRDGRSFEDVTEASGAVNRGWSTSAAFFDYDRDGWLDLFVANYVQYDPDQPCVANGGGTDFCNPAMFPRATAKLFRNRTGDSVDRSRPVFEDRSQPSGIAEHAGAALGVVCGDLNRDGWPDVYVANDGHANFLWINQQNGTFREQALVQGVAYDKLGRSQGSMGVALEDVDGDLTPDLFVTNLDGETNSLYLAKGEQSFEESSTKFGLGAPSYPFTGFGTALVDLDHDGDLDALVANGRVRRKVSAPFPSADVSLERFWADYREANLLFVNQGNGRFRASRSKVDPFVAVPSVSRSLAVGDYDDDGDLDLIITTSGGSARLLRNELKSSGHWVRIRAVLPEQGGRDALGAEITLRAGERAWRRWVNPGASYLSSHDPRVHFGLGDAAQVDHIEVLWPDGLRERFQVDQVDRGWTFERGRGVAP